MKRARVDVRQPNEKKKLKEEKKRHLIVDNNLFGHTEV